MILAAVTSSVAQNKSKQERIQVDFYGIDFTEVNVVGAEETQERFVTAFGQINGLMISEQKKYNIGKYFNLNVVSTDVDHAINRLHGLQNIDFKDQETGQPDLARIVADYPSSDNNGMVIVAKELNKLTNVGKFIAVIYDGQTKQILFEKEFSGKAGGFGLRNYWAGAFYNGIKDVKF